MPSAQYKQIDALTSLRFFAAFYVLVYHSGSVWLSQTRFVPRFVENFLGNGYLGVSFFFVLSGFILTYVYANSSMGSGDRRQYARSRFARVYPAFFVSLILMIPFVEVGPVTSWIWQFLMLQKWTPSALPLSSAIANWNAQAWTLSVELLFYILFPFVLVGSRPLSDRTIVIGTFVVAALMTALRLPGIPSDHSLPYSWMAWVPFPVLRTPEFLYGVLLGILFVRGKVKSSPALLASVITALILILAVSRSLWVASAAALLFGGVIALTPGGLSTGLSSKCLTSPLLVLLGQASYGIYILQLPVRYLFRDYIEPTFPLGARLGYIPALILISILALRFFEEPVRGLIRRSFPRNSGAVS